ncbi:MAG: hypothetical protein K1W39_05265 [Lachnospiraceae bacterium]|jgi:Capsule polysaccharide export protein
MNILCRGNGSRNGYQSAVLRKIEEAGIFDKCVIINEDIDGKDRYLGQKYKYIDIGLGYKNSYCDSYDINKLLPLSKDIICRMQPYETSAMRMTMRLTGFPVSTYNEAMDEYLLHLRFWNHIIEEEKIDLVYFSVIPHFIFEYVIYGLAKSKGLRVVVSDAIHIKSYNFLIGDSIESMGYKVKDYYDELLKNETETVILRKDFEDFYQSVINESVGILTLDEMNEKKYLTDKDISLRYISEPVIESQMKCYLQRLKGDKSLNENKRYSIDKLDFKAYIDRVNKSKNMCRILVKKEEYETYTQIPDYNEKYIYYALQLTPEATTLPMAGIFENQLLSLQILSYVAAKNNILIYVKEHYVQYGREKKFYELINNLPNVKLISVNIPSMVLIKNSIAVSTQTGSCILEGMIKEKPSITFSKGYWSYGPGVYYVDNAIECERVVKLIINKEYKITQKKVRKFLKAYQMASFLSTHDCIEIEQENFSFDEYVKQTSQAVIAEMKKYKL